MSILNDDELPHIKQHIQLELAPICEADPNVLSDYIIALLRHDMDLANLKSFCKEQLEDFLRECTSSFVEGLFSVLVSKDYSTPKGSTGTEKVLPLPQGVHDGNSQKLAVSQHLSLKDPLVSFDSAAPPASQINTRETVGKQNQQKENQQQQQQQQQQLQQQQQQQQQQSPQQKIKIAGGSNIGNSKPLYPNATQAGASSSSISSTETATAPILAALGSMEKQYHSQRYDHPLLQQLDLGQVRPASEFVEFPFSNEKNSIGGSKSFAHFVSRQPVRTCHGEEGVGDGGRFGSAHTSSRNGVAGIGNYQRPRQGYCYEFYDSGSCSRGSSCFYEHVFKGAQDDNEHIYHRAAQHSSRDPQIAHGDLSSTLGGRSRRGQRHTSGSMGVGGGAAVTLSEDSEQRGQSPRWTRTGYRGVGEANSFLRSGITRRTPQRPNQAILIENLPADACAVAPLQSYFAHFGSILDIKLEPLEQRAVIQYSSVEEATAAHNSPDPIFDNRFIRVRFHHLPEHNDVAAASSLLSDQRHGAPAWHRYPPHQWKNQQKLQYQQQFQPPGFVGGSHFVGTHQQNQQQQQQFPISYFTSGEGGFGFSGTGASMGSMQYGYNAPGFAGNAFYSGNYGQNTTAPGWSPDAPTKTSEISRKQTEMLKSLGEMLQAVQAKLAEPVVSEALAQEYKTTAGRLETQIHAVSESIAQHQLMMHVQHQQSKLNAGSFHKLGEKRKREQLDRELDMIASQIHRAANATEDVPLSLLTGPVSGPETAPPDADGNHSAGVSTAGTESQPQRVAYYAPNPYVFRKNGPAGAVSPSATFAAVSAASTTTIASSSGIGSCGSGGAWDTMMLPLSKVPRSRFNIDLRPTSVIVGGFNEGQKDEVAREFANFGEIESTESTLSNQDQQTAIISTIVIKYRTRAQAEKAIHFGPKLAQTLGSDSVTVQWKK